MTSLVAFCTVISWFVFTFFMLPLAFAGGMLRLARPEREDTPLFALCCASLAPLSLSVVLYWTYRLFPGSATPFAVVCIMGAFSLATAIYGRREAAELFHLLQRYVRAWRGRLHASPRRCCASLFIFALVVLFAYIQLGHPLADGNDVLEYLVDGRVIFEAKDISIYPLTDVARTNGIYFPSMHPPGFPLLIAWSYMPLGTDSTLCFRLMSVWYMLFWLGLTACAAHRLQANAALVSVVLLVLMSRVSGQVLALEGDLIRLTTFQAVFILGSFLPGMERYGWKPFFMFGACAGLGIFVHSISLLLLPLLGGTLVVLCRRNRRFILRLALISTPVCCAVGAWQYFFNWLYTGMPIHDYVPVWELPFLHWHTDLAVMRNLATLKDRLLNGPLSLFTNYSLYGISGLLLPGAAMLLWRRRLGMLPKTLLLGALLYLLMLFTCAFADIPLAIKNSRYIMTIVPLLLPPGAAGLVLICSTGSKKIVNFLLQNRFAENAVFGILRRLTAAVTWGTNIVPQNTYVAQKEYLCGIASTRKRLRWGTSCILACIFLAVLQHVAHVHRYYIRSSHPWRLLTEGDKAVLLSADHPYTPIVATVDALAGQKVLVMSGMHSLLTFYTRTPNISEHDNRCEPFYRAQTPEAGLAALRELGITHIIKANWQFPMHYRTTLPRILTAPSMASIITGKAGHTLFALTPASAPQPLSSGNVESLPCVPDNRYRPFDAAKASSNETNFIVDGEQLWLKVPPRAHGFTLHVDVSGQGTLHMTVRESFGAEQRETYSIDMGTFDGTPRTASARLRLREECRMIALYFYKTPDAAMFTLRNICFAFHQGGNPVQ